jgi:hypothetical protein
MKLFGDKKSNDLASFIFSKVEHKYLIVVATAFAIFTLLMLVVNGFMFIARFLLNMEFAYVPLYVIVAGVMGFLAAGFISMYDLGVVNTKYKSDLDKIRAKYNSKK